MKKMTLAFSLLITLVLLLPACNPDEDIDNPMEEDTTDNSFGSNSFYPLVFEDTVKNEQEYDIDLDGIMDLRVYTYWGALAYEFYKGISVEPLSTFSVKTQEYRLLLCRDTLLSYNPYEEVYEDYYERYECTTPEYFTDTLYYQAPAFFQENELDLNLIDSLASYSGYIPLYYYLREYPNGAYYPYPLGGDIFDTYTKSIFKEQEEGFLILENNNGQRLKMKVEFLSDDAIFVDYVDEL